MNKTKALTETSIITALLVILILLNIYVPLFSIVGIFILPIPITIIYLRWGYKYSLMSILVSSLLTVFFSDPIVGILSGILSGSIGFALGFCLSHKIDYKKTILILTIVSTISLGLTNYIMISLVQMDTVRGFVDKLVVSYNQSIDTVLKSNMIPQSNLENLKSLKQSINTDVILNQLPVIILIAGLLTALIDYNMARVFLKRLKFKMPEKPPFTEFCFGKNTSLFLIIFILVGIAINYLKLPFGAYVLNSLVMVVAYIFIIEGIAVASYYLRRKLKLSKVLTVLMIILLLNQPFIFLYIYLGLADLIIDFRRVSFKKGLPKKEIQ